MGAGADVQQVVGLPDPEVAEEHLRHRLVVVLTRVHEHLLDATTLERCHDGCRLHQVRPRADDGEDPHARGKLVQFAQAPLDALAARDQLALELLDRRAPRAQQAELALDVAERLVEDHPSAVLVHVTGVPLRPQRSASVLCLDQRLQLVERDAEQLLELQHLAQALDVGLVVGAVRAMLAVVRALQQPDLLVVADRARRGADLARYVADPHVRAGSASGTRTWAGRISETTAPTSDTAASTHNAVCMLWMKGASC